MVDTSQGFPKPLRVECIDAKNWRILEDFPWVGTKGDIFMIEKGSYTDFASTPWWTQAILPRTGTWTKAAVVHDKMCDELNAYHKAMMTWERLQDGHHGRFEVALVKPERPTFGPIDTDAVFRKNARELGTDPIRSELLWMGVRLGALVNPARSEGWIKTAPRVIADLVATGFFLYLILYFIVWLVSLV